jgi:hypothetical protein
MDKIGSDTTRMAEPKASRIRTKVTLNYKRMQPDWASYSKGASHVTKNGLSFIRVTLVRGKRFRS